MISPSYTDTQTHTHRHTHTHTHKCKHTHAHAHMMTTDNYFKFSKSLNWIHILFLDCVFTVIYEIFACCRGWENFFIKGHIVNDLGFVIYTISASANLFPSYSVKAVTKKKVYINECLCSSNCFLKCEFHYFHVLWNNILLFKMFWVDLRPLEEME